MCAAINTDDNNLVKPDLLAEPMADCICFTISSNRLARMSNRQRQIRYSSCIRDFKVRVKRILDAVNGDLLIEVRGKPEDMKRSRKYLLCELAIEETMEFSNNIPQYVLESTIKGKFREIEDQYQCSINVMYDANIISIHASQNNDLIQHGIHSILLQEASLSEETLEVIPTTIPFIIGPFGRSKSELITKSGITHLTLTTLEGKIIIRGETNAREKAKEAIQQIQSTYKNYQSTTLRLTEAHLEYVLKNRSNIIDKILESTGVGIFCKIPKSGNKTVTLIHKDAAAAKMATEAINELTERPEIQLLSVRPGFAVYFLRALTNRRWLPGFEIEMTSDRTLTAKGPACEMRRFRSTALAFIKVIGNTLDVGHVDVSPETLSIFVDENNMLLRGYARYSDCFGWYEDEKLKIIGPANSLRQIIRDMSRDPLRSQYLTEVQVSPVHFASIIGVRGSNVQRLRDEFGVIIHVPRRGAPLDSKIKIIGDRGKVDACKARILENIAAIESGQGTEVILKETVNVPSYFRGAIIGHNGATIRSIRESTHVKIKIPKIGDSDEEPITIEGKAADVSRAKSRIEELLTTLKSEVIEFPAALINHFVNRQNRVKSLYTNGYPQIRLDGTTERGRFVVHGASEAVDNFVAHISGEIEKAETSSSSSHSATATTPLANGSANRPSDGNIELVFRPTNTGPRPFAQRRFQRRPDPLAKYCFVNTSTIPRLIGRQGAQINAFQNEHNVRVRFGKFPERPEMVEVIGRHADQVDNAIDALTAFASVIERNQFDLFQGRQRRNYFSRNPPNQPPNINALDEFPKLTSS